VLLLEVQDSENQHHLSFYPIENLVRKTAEEQAPKATLVERMPLGMLGEPFHGPFHLGCKFRA
jgi:hypothetical protein